MSPCTLPFCGNSFWQDVSLRLRATSMQKPGLPTDLNGYFLMCTLNSNMEPLCSNTVQFVPVRSCLMAWYKLTKDSVHQSRWCTVVELTIPCTVYTKVNRVRSNSSWCRWPTWFERPAMSLNMSVSFLGMISSQMTSSFFVLRREASSASRTENSPLLSKCTPTSRIW